MHIRTALIPAAGFGTRFLPITKTIQKEMLPILGRPLIDYVVDDLIQAGVERILLVVSEHNNQIIHFYSDNTRLYEYLKAHTKLHLYDQVKTLHEKAEFVFIRQPDKGEYGTAVPLKMAEPYLKDENAFFVFMGDDFLFQAQNGNEACHMLQVLQNSHAEGLMTCISKPESELHRYGVVETIQKKSHVFLHSIIEKPAAGTAPTNLVNVSKYIMNPTIFDYLAKQKINPDSQELYITDTLVAFAKQHPTVIYQPQGEYLDGGNTYEWLKANITVAAADPSLKSQMQQWMK